MRVLISLRNQRFARVPARGSRWSGAMMQLRAFAHAQERRRELFALFLRALAPT
ncbi:MAG: hypothetical protein ABW136_07200 [Steroidobacteraceae bacterium]